MRQGVLGPGFLAAQGDGVTGRSLGLLEAVALLPAKGQHAVQVGHLGRSGQGLQGQAQHARRRPG